MSEIWKAASVLRGTMDAYAYKDVVLSLIYYRYLSRNVKRTAELFLESGEDYENAWKCKEKQSWLKRKISSLGYCIAPENLYDRFLSLSEKGLMTYEILDQSFQALKASSKGLDSEDFFSDLFHIQPMDNLTLSRLIVAMRNDDVKSGDLLGEEYMEFLNWFVDCSGKKGGEYYSPDCLCRLVAGLVGIYYDHIESLSDPSCGSGSLLLSVCKEIEVEHVHGRDLNPSAYRLAKMNAMLHSLDYRNVKFELGDSLMDTGNEIYQVQVANPPFSLEWKPFKSEKYPISLSGQRADYAFVQHIIYHMQETAIVILPLGTLYRQNEKKVRKWLIENNYIETVIKLSGKLFHGNKVPVCIMVFRAYRDDREILFIDASREFVKKKNGNMLAQENIRKIVNAAQNRKDITGFAKLIKTSELDDYCLNISIIQDEEKETHSFSELNRFIRDRRREVLEMEEFLSREVEMLDYQDERHC